jgi:flagellar assembly protein FliH
MSLLAERYAFPEAAQFDSKLQGPSNQAEIEAQEAAIQEAIARGYDDGFAQGQSAVESASKEIFERARQQGFAAGYDQGLVQSVQAAAALRQAFDQFSEWRADLKDQAESFCVELTLAIVARLIELNETRADFVKRAVQGAIVALDPESPQTISVNPADARFAASAFPEVPVTADESIPPGGARIEGGRLLVDGSVRQVFEQVKRAVLETRVRRIEQKLPIKRELGNESGAEPVRIAASKE